MENIITVELLDQYVRYLREEEKSVATIEKYILQLQRLAQAMNGASVDRLAVNREKERLAGKQSPGTVNGAIAAWNSFFKWAGWYTCCVKPLRIQRELFMKRERELTRAEYFRLLDAAERRKDKQLYYILQTICATGIRISELPYITVEALKKGKARICCKGKIRTILLPRKLGMLLLAFCRERKILRGSVFVSRNGKSMDRSNIWRAMQNLCEAARVPKEKVFPHNLRHLFARSFYAAQKDLDALAAVLGHSNINTTRIYTMSSEQKHIQVLERLNLIC